MSKESFLEELEALGAEMPAGEAVKPLDCVEALTKVALGLFSRIADVEASSLELYGEGGSMYACFQDDEGQQISVYSIDGGGLYPNDEI